MIAKILIFFVDILINLRYFFDELSIFISNIAQWPHIAYRGFQAFYKDYQEIIFSIIIIAIILYVLLLIFYNDKKFK